MARTLSSAAIRAMYSQEGGSTWVILLLTISHPTLAAPIRIASDGTLAGSMPGQPWQPRYTPSRGNNYIQFPFAITMPDEDDQKPPKATITIDNVDRSIVAAIRNMGTVPANILLELVTNTTPDTVEFSSGELTLRDVHYDALSVAGTLGFEAILNEPFPGDLVTPATIPGVFLSV